MVPLATYFKSLTSCVHPLQANLCAARQNLQGVVMLSASWNEQDWREQSSLDSAGKVQLRRQRAALHEPGVDASGLRLFGTLRLDRAVLTQPVEV